MNKDNVGGKFDQVAGKIKQSVGEAAGSKKLANAGAAQQVKGHAKEAWGNVKDTASSFLNQKTPRQEKSGHSARESVNSTAEKAKKTINRGLDSLKNRKAS